MTCKALLEVGVEELPSTEVKNLTKQLNEQLEILLNNYKLKYESIRTFVGSRRFGVLIDGLLEKQEDFFEEKRGPAKKISFENGEPTRALEGFLRANNATVEDVVVKEIKGIPYVFLKRTVRGKNTEELLPVVFKDLLNSLKFRKPMRWGVDDFSFVRPVKWIVAMLNDKVIEFEAFGKKASNWSKGHRFFFDKVEVNAETYFENLRKALVLADIQDRKARVLNELKRVENELNAKIPVDEELLEEVVSLTEYPTAVVGEFLEKYLELPPEVIIVTIKHHQRTFPVYLKGELSKEFVAFQDGPGDPKGNVKRGYEEVINARLEDAHFYYYKDLSKPLDSYNETLKDILFQRSLGSMYDKTLRIRKLSDAISEKLFSKPEERAQILRTAELSKADLGTRIVYEFPELQGTMGRIYALKSGEPEEVAQGIEEHYKDNVAEIQTLSGAVVGIADRIDTIVGNFFLGNIPSGSKDPYGIRRKFQFVFNIFCNLGWYIDIKDLYRHAAEIYGFDYEKFSDKLETFTQNRYENFLMEKGYSIRIARAVNSWWNLPYNGELVASALKSIVGNAEFNNLLIAYQRVHNISKKHDSTRFDGRLFLKEEEKSLFNEYLKVYDSLKKHIDEHKFDSAIEDLVSLKEPIDKYFDNVFVMDNQPDIRLNRLGFLKALDELFLKIADFSQLLDEGV
ncbi:glycine--tRNA ligase subunit beta [Kosmotoga arenicorallina]|nr:glycine--tRNA ligase subunit beta [Kosmotoga arenicorallina]